MKDKLVIHELVAEGRLGVFDWEQAKPQPIWIDLEVAIDAARAAAKDDMRDAVDYGRLVTAVKQHAEHHRFRLLETLAEGIAQLVLKEFKTPQVLVRVKKRALPGIDYAAVEVVRGSRAGTSRRSAAFPTAARRTPAGAESGRRRR